MKRFLHKVLWSSLYILVVYLVLLVLWGNFFTPYFNKNLKYKMGMGGYMNTRLKEVDTTAKVDILFLGSSHTYRGFDNRIFKKHGYTSFNLGSSNQTPIQTKLLLEKYLDKLNPALVIYEVYPETFEMDGVESGIDIISNSNNLDLAFKNCLFVHHITAYNTFAFSLIRKYLFNDLNYIEHAKTQSDVYISGGFVQSSLEGNVKNSTMSIVKKDWDFRDEQWDAFLSSVILIKASGKKVVFVQAPFTKGYYNLYRNNELINNKFKQQGYFLNFNTIQTLNLNDTLDFYDEHHLTQSGVNKFNNSLIGILQQNKVLDLKSK